MSIRKAWYKKGKQLLDEIKETKVSEDELAIWYLGQCGFVVKQQKIIYIDPVLNDMRDENGYSRRFYEPPFEPEMAEADYVFCTHGHDDHMARETVLALIIFGIREISLEICRQGRLRLWRRNCLLI